MNCSDFLELVTPFLDGACKGEEPALLEAHVASCAGCRAKFDRVSRLVAAVRALPRLRCPADISSPIGSFILAEAISFMGSDRMLTGLSQSASSGGQPGVFEGSYGDPDGKNIRKAARTLSDFRAIAAVAAVLLLVYTIDLFCSYQANTDLFKLAYVEQDKIVFDAVTRASPKLFGQHIVTTTGESKKTAATEQNNVVALTTESAMADATGVSSANAEAGAIPAAANEGDAPTASRELARRLGEPKTVEEPALLTTDKPDMEDAQGSSPPLTEKNKSLPSREIVVRRKNLTLVCANVQETLEVLRNKLASQGFTILDTDTKPEAHSEQSPHALEASTTGLIVSLTEADLSRLITLLRSLPGGTIKVADLPPRVVRCKTAGGELGRLTDSPVRKDRATAESKQGKVPPAPGKGEPLTEPRGRDDTSATHSEFPAEHVPAPMIEVIITVLAE